MNFMERVNHYHPGRRSLLTLRLTDSYTGSKGTISVRPSLSNHS